MSKYWIEIVYKCGKRDRSEGLSLSSLKYKINASNYLSGVKCINYGEL